MTPGDLYTEFFRVGTGMAFYSCGGDTNDQWALVNDLQVKLTVICSSHAPGSFHPHRRAMISIYTLASSVLTDFGGVLEPEDVDVDNLIDADVSAETFVWLDNHDLREDLDEPSTLPLQLGTSTTPTLDPADAPCTPSALTGHRKNTSTSFYAEGVSVSKAVFRLTSFTQNQLEAINATLWNRICMWDIRLPSSLFIRTV
ncbi:hypothetical protein EV424DRAFT_1536636 [Suillus variegatus]|nr:hypothetical protein EV424DRAFT_1536636 [Suillus variegatus]